MSAATDLYLAVYPAIVLFNLQLKLRKKLALTAALSIGSMCVTLARKPRGVNANRNRSVPLSSPSTRRPASRISPVRTSPSTPRTS